MMTLYCHAPLVYEMRFRLDVYEVDLCERTRLCCDILAPCIYIFCRAFQDEFCDYVIVCCRNPSLFNIPKRRVSIELLWRAVLFQPSFAAVFTQRAKVFSFTTGSESVNQIIDHPLHIVL